MCNHHNRPLPQVGDLEAVVAAATCEVDARLMEVLRERAGLVRHADALRRYVLLGQVRWLPRRFPHSHPAACGRVPSFRLLAPAC